MNIESITALIILLPMIIALSSFVDNQLFRRSVLVGMSVVLTLSSIYLFMKGPFQFEPSADLVNWHLFFTWADFILLGIILSIGIYFRHKLVFMLVVLQLIPLILIKASGYDLPYDKASLAGDQLSLMLVVIVCVVGCLIVIYATEYMRIHSRKHPSTAFRLGGFFFFLILFLGAMNGLLLSNNLLWMFFFWELTTLCSYALIAHDRTDEASACALRALWMNLLGGVCFIWAIYLLHSSGQPLELSRLTQSGPLPLLMLPVALMCIAALTKSAQLPFQSWLTGAMVAPAPVSALLHSSTMVNAGVFLILKLVPVYTGTPLASYLTILGALTFICTAVLALTQRNAKKILAYSTIGTLGLVIACAGMGTPQAYSAAMLLILFHALAKALLFMGVGHIDQLIGSKNIEDMWGLVEKCPGVSRLLVFGMISMFLPPFGALVSKWMAVHSAGSLPVIVLILALASAVTVFYWTRWAGMIINSQGPANLPEQKSLSGFIEFPLYALAFMGLALSLLVIFVYTRLTVPMAGIVFPGFDPEQSISVLMQNAGAFFVYPVFLILGFAVMHRLFKTSKIKKAQLMTPYYSGLNREEQQQSGFVDPLGSFIPFGSENYYLKQYLSEKRINTAINVAAIGLIILLVATSL